MQDMDGRRAVVTGSATGLGRSMAVKLAERGASVVVNYSRSGAEAEETADLCRAAGVDVTVVKADVSQPGGCRALAEAAGERIDILMNNAGRTWGAPLGQHPYEAWDKLLRLNVTGMFHLTQSLLPLMLKASTPGDPARVVNVGSVMGEIPKGTATYSYAVSKGAVHHMTRVLSNDLAPQGITVNAIAPGPFVSNMTAFAIGTEEGQERSAKGIPLGRVGCPEDIAGTLQYLCGKGGAYVSGAVLPLSGGLQSHAPANLFNEEL